AHTEQERAAGPRIDRGADHTAGDHDRIGEREQRFQCLPRDLELVRRAEEVPMIRREHDRVAIRRPDDSSETVLESPRHEWNLALSEFVGTDAVPYSFRSLTGKHPKSEPFEAHRLHPSSA